jgi:WD40 repeat protein
VVTANADRTAKVWDARTGKLLATLDGHADELVDAKLGRDGTRIVTASRDGTIWTSDVHLEARDRETVLRIVDAADPWQLANGVLVPHRAGP